MINQFFKQFENVFAMDYEGSKNNKFQKVIGYFIEKMTHLALTDIQLRAYDGFHWGKEIRVISNAPIII